LVGALYLMLSRVVEVSVPPLVAENVGSVPPDCSGSNGEGSSNNDDEGSGSDVGEDKAKRIPFRKAPSGIMWYKCPICLREDYDSVFKVVLHTLDVIK
jgi:hypothetical protein